MQPQNPSLQRRTTAAGADDDIGVYLMRGTVGGGASQHRHSAFERPDSREVTVLHKNGMDFLSSKELTVCNRSL